MPSRLRKKTNAKKDMKSYETRKCRTKPSPSPPYTKEQMRAAVQRVLEGKPMAAAARDNCVPRTSLLYKAKGLRPLEKKMGPKTILTSHEEKFIGNSVLSISKAGFPTTRVELLDSVQRLLGEIQRENPFTQNRPGKKWLECFLKRHPSVTLRTPQNLTNSRASIKQHQILEWSSVVYSYLVENDYAQILHDPMRVFNGDESAFFLCPKGEKVLAQKGNKIIYQHVNNDEKECITVLVTANAAGQFAPPLLVFKYERIPSEILDGVDPSFGIGKSESGRPETALAVDLARAVSGLPTQSRFVALARDSSSLIPTVTMVSSKQNIARAALAIALVIKRKRERRNRRRIWVKEWVLQRKLFGVYTTLLPELTASDPKMYMNFVRMSATNFQELLSKISPLIKKQDTTMRESIQPGERLAVTLRFLASGDSYYSLSYLFRIPVQTISKIVPECCDAIYRCLQSFVKRYAPPDVFDRPDENGDDILGTWRNDSVPDNLLFPLHPSSAGRNVSNACKNIRDEFKEYFVSSQGEVPWQHKFI
ncbi:hypothetical protein GE061_012767 [Apolygus lucorum]|uniref:HTH CENPB-type domain-containing protein n=1 Tax=Apolygus lucorum TaxID=248454 RepID=A0A8S9XVW5_APOLU|nr:hypothetical protein GE061_012767 [Apolygus lucorum]